MSLATNIKEFADVLHNIYAQQLSLNQSTDIVSDGILPLAIPKLIILQQACLYLAKSFLSGIFYLLSFQWLRDISYLPLISPEKQNIHDTFLSEPFSYLFSFAKNGVGVDFAHNISSSAKEAISYSQSFQVSSLEDALYTAPSYGLGTSATQGLTALFNGFFRTDSLLSGLVNSFFFSLPFSLPHLVTLRRMFSQGVAAATASILGIVTAHSLILAGVLYGIRLLIIPYYSFQSLAFLVGLITIAIHITEFVKEKRVYLVPITQTMALVRIAALSFVLALCESATVFHDLHHLTLNSKISYLQLSSSQNVLDSFFSHTAYLIAFVLGHTLFSLVFCYWLLKGVEKACSLTGWTLPQTARRINKSLLIALLTLTFSSFPYYGLDFLFTKSLGFLPEDPAYRNTIFSPTQVRSRNRHFKSRAPAAKNSKTPLELDLNYFDRGVYLNAPKEEKLAEISSSYNSEELDIAESGVSSEMASTYDPALTFEELNYQGESAWLMRHERARRLPEEQDPKKESVFQKSKSHFKQLRLNAEAKQAEAALKEGAQIGSISEWKEGSKRGESIEIDQRLTKVSPSCPHGIAHTFESLRSRDVSATPSKSFTVRYPKEVRTGRERVQSLLENPFRNEKSWEEDDKKALLKELSFEKEIASAYEKSFASPFGEESDGTPPDLLPVENIIKKRYRLNPVYRALLQSDIDFFIARQPEAYKITQNQEASLFKKRKLLEKYYNSLRYYSPVETIGFTKRFKKKSASSNLSKTESNLVTLPYKENAKDDLDTSTLLEESRSQYSRQRKNFTKSFVESLYHQQFKGTLSTVKRFFKVTFDNEQNASLNRILSYDQFLYKKEKPSSFSFHNLDLNSKDQDYKNRSLSEIGNIYHPSLHEELRLQESNIVGNPFIEESNSVPIYAGWDDRARRFVITNFFNFIE